LGRETRLQAVPENWPLLAQTRAGELAGDCLQTVFCYLGWLRGKQASTDREAYFALETDPAYLTLYQQVLHLLDEEPAVLWRTADLDRRFEVLLYLLCETTADEARRSTFRWAISGRGRVHELALAGQGAPIQWNDALTTQQIHVALQDLEFAELAQHFGTQKFLDTPLYKKSDDRREVGSLHYFYCQLKEYYRAAAGAGDATLIVLD